MSSKLFAPVDMTEGNPVVQIIRFTIPMLLGNVAQQLYNTVDSIIVGRFVGRVSRGRICLHSLPGVT